MSYELLLPEIVLTVVSFIVLLLGISRTGKVYTGHLTLGGLLVSLVVLGIMYSEKGTLLFDALVIDPFSQFFKLVFLIVSILTVIASLKQYSNNENVGEYYFLILLATVGMMFVASSNDLISLFVAFELGSIATYLLAGFDRDNPKSVEAGFKYFIIGATSSAILLLGMSMIYGITGCTNFDELAAMDFGSGGYALVAVVLLVAGFGFKIALVPFHMWAPDTYHGAPDTVSVLLAAGSKKMGFVAAFKLIILVLIALRTEWYLVFAVLTVITMTYGNLAALTQRSLKRMLAYSSIAQAGYISMVFVILAIAPLGPEGASLIKLAAGGALFYVLSHAFMKGGAFLVVGAVSYMLAKEKLNSVLSGDDIEHYSGLGKTAPLTAFSMTVFLFALAGIPLTAGFMSKLLIFSSAIYAGLAWLAIIAILNSALSLYYYARVVKVMYWGTPAPEMVGKREPAMYMVAIMIALIGTILLGVYPEPFVNLAMQAAEVFI
ncbi:MAG: NADH-quinone oxidoreductase subunit N [Methermicoccaceae archaeon]